MRVAYPANLERILVFEVNQRPLHHRSIAFSQLLQPNCPVVNEMKRLRYIRENIWQISLKESKWVKVKIMSEIEDNHWNQEIFFLKLKSKHT